MIVKTTNIDVEAYAGEHIDKFVDRLVREFNAERNNISMANGHAQRNNTTVTGHHNDSSIVLSIKHK